MEFRFLVHWTLQNSACDNILRFAIIHTVLCSLPLLSRDFQLRELSFLWVTELSPVSAKSDSKKSSQSHVTADGQSVSMSWCLVHSGTYDQILFSV
jgi:hypothetical protein